jgi:hypothetical protein
VVCPDERVRFTSRSLIFICFLWSASAGIIWFRVDREGLSLGAIGGLLGVVAANVLHPARQLRRRR